MKKIGLMMILAILILLTIVSSTRWLRKYDRPNCWAVRESETTVVAKDLSGNIWSVLVVESDPFEHGWVTLKMDDNGTEDIHDDIVLGFEEIKWSASRK